MVDPTAASHIDPTSTEAEAVAIVAALDAVWPRGEVAMRRGETDRWRWSGRWWTKPDTLRRDRPW